MSNNDWQDITIYNAFYEANDPEISVFGAAASGGMYLLYDSNPYLIRINKRDLVKPSISLKTGFYHGNVLFDRDDAYIAISGSFKRGLHNYLRKAYDAGNQSILPDELKDYLLNNLAILKD